MVFRPMEPDEAKNLLTLMGTRDIQLLEKVLVTVSNLATFTPNQVSFKQVFTLYVCRFYWYASY